ncbi:hypothetical protein VPNG_03926 [Cytospora leucostoma]|uniref:Uncharacterized protein n=1 Tax=Cytospora leucostoma TaxID=1230097 RepID=A0A423XDX5_9PEZI|nr:hypothetical protein VPNG_03926 [Cytospora leucostoma]
MSTSSSAPAASPANPSHDPDQISVEPPRLELTTAEDSIANAEGSSEEEDFYGTHDDAQTFIQPVISLAATRLTSPRTPAVERVAAMDQVVSGYFDGVGSGREDESSGGDETPRQEGPKKAVSRHEATDSDSEPQRGRPLLPAGEETKLPLDTSIPPPQPQCTESLPAPWRTGPKEIVVASPSPQSHKPALAGVFKDTRHRRSTSGSAEALRRLSKALPSISLPSMPNRLPTPSFFSSSSSSKSESRHGTPHGTPSHSPGPQSPRLGYSNHASTFPIMPQSKSPSSQAHASSSTDTVHEPSTGSLEPLGLKKSTSDDSMLYHSLSRVSSFGDDERFTHIREQVNSRFKAIVDSFEPPSFKLPSMPTTLLSPLKKTEFSTTEIEAGPRRSSSLRTMKPPKDPLDHALEQLTGDVVILGGYRGSILRSAEPPHRQLWVPIKVGLNVRKVNMEVGLDPEDEERMEETIIPSGMLKNVGPVDITKRLFKRMRECDNAKSGKLRVHDYGYDWRLSPHLLSRKMVEFLKTLPSNQGDKPSGALVLAHSLGGIITRHAVNQAPELFSGVIYAGSPQRCINILGPLRNGDAVLLNEKVLTAHVNFTLRTTFVFLPEDGFCFVDKVTNEEYRVDFYDPNEWVRHRLCPSVSDPPLPPFHPKRNGPLGSFLSLSDSLSFPRARSTSDPAAKRGGHTALPHRKLLKDRTLAPQMDTSASSTEQQDNFSHADSPEANTTRARNLAYLTRTLAETKRFRAEGQHNPEHQAANRYPPIAVIYGKEIPTVYAARVSCREAIACTDVYDDLVFHSGDGVVLAREAMPPPGYEIARGGRISSDRGHISLLGDMNAVGRALEAVARGRRKGIGLGVGARPGPT